MTEIAFHFNAPDKVAYGCRLLRKAYLSGSRVLVTASAEVLRKLDLALWTFSPTEFVPHCFEAHDANLASLTPVLLAVDTGQAPVLPVLVNLGQEIPAGFERFERLIEVVTGEDADRFEARNRWKHYAQRGYQLQRHDLALKASA